MYKPFVVQFLGRTFFWELDQCCYVKSAWENFTVNDSSAQGKDGELKLKTSLCDEVICLAFLLIELPQDSKEIFISDSGLWFQVQYTQNGN